MLVQTCVLFPPPRAGEADAWTFSYFLFYNPPGNTNDLIFAATSMYGGDVAVYVNNQINPNTRELALPTLSCNPTVCSNWQVDNSLWSSTSSFSRERVVIPAADAFYTNGTYYVVGVLAIAQASGFAVTGTIATGTDLVQLQSGIPYDDQVDLNGYNFYRLTMDAFQSDVIVSLTPLNGDPDL